jgi:sterol desaturase/sphingolipid hydroxylase (fatty acid hydroxylase superfamily)
VQLFATVLAPVREPSPPNLFRSPPAGGDWYHQLHHRYFNLNYGNKFLPIDKLTDSWHNGSEDSLQTQKQRWRARF